MFGGPNVILVF